MFSYISSYKYYITNELFLLYFLYIVIKDMMLNDKFIDPLIYQAIYVLQKCL